MGSRFTIVLISLVVIFGGIFFISKHKAAAPTGGNSTAQASNHTEGGGKKGVTLVEYGDFQCPACTAYYPIVKQAVEAHKADITFQFINYPLTQLHPNAMAAHRAAEAAGLQGKFWEMHDLLYSQHDSWATSNNAASIFQGYAQQLGLNLDKFKSDANSAAVNDVIQADLKKGQALNVTGTPTFFLDGKQITDVPRDADSFSKLIQQAIDAKTTGQNQ